MSLLCIVTLTMERDGVKRTWKGDPESRDFDRLEAFKNRDGWKTVKHGREFIEHSQDGVRKDAVEFKSDHSKAVTFQG